MTATENIYLAVGEVAYAIAKADGKIQREEKERLKEILKEEFGKELADTNHASIIFHVLQKENLTSRMAYDAAIHELNINSHYLSKEMKEHIVHIIEKVATAFPPKTPEENTMIQRFIIDVGAIKIDPVLSKGL